MTATPEDPATLGNAPLRTDAALASQSNAEPLHITPPPAVEALYVEAASRLGTDMPLVEPEKEPIVVEHPPGPVLAIGRIVHFTMPDIGEPCPAIVTRVHNATLVDLTVFLPGRQPTYATSVVQIDVNTRGIRGWYWPPRG